MAGGRPLTKIDWEEFDKLCHIQCLQSEIAEWFGCTDDTIQAAVLREKGMGFSEYYEQKRGQGKISLRRLQWQTMQKGNVTMLIWLGKQYLNQSDKTEFDFKKATKEQLTAALLEKDATLGDSGASGNSDPKPKSKSQGV
jgi:hypothetical protein